MRDSKALRIVLYLILFGCIIIYIKVYIIDVRKSSIDLPKKVTSSRWYKYDDYTYLEFSVGNIKTNNEALAKCNKYSYDKSDKKITLNCSEYNLKLISVSDYKLMLMIDQGTNSKAVTYYKYKEIIDYMKENDIESISDEDIEENIELPKRINDSDYRNAEMNKLTVVKELALLELNDVLKRNNSLILIINPNTRTSSYNIIPIFISWMNNYTNYNFYYINGNNMNVNDKTLLDQFEDESLKDYILGFNDLNMILVKDDDYKVLNVSINTVIEHDKIFTCSDDCSDIDLTIMDKEEEISVKDIFK